jgi:hypothetical protein
MIDGLLIDIIKSGTISFVLTKATKELGQKSISEIIGFSGWLIVGTDVIQIIEPVSKTITKICVNIDGFFQTLTKLTETWSKLDNGFGEFIKRGFIHSTTKITEGVTGGW